MESFEERLIIRYLLGELSEEERYRFEEQYFSRDSSVDLLEAVRDDLIDSYLGGQLPQAERERFEQHFLASPHHAKKLEFTRSLKKLLTDTPPQPAVPSSGRAEQHSWWRFPSLLLDGNFRIIAAATAVMLIVTSGYLVFRAVFWHSSDGETQTDLIATDAAAADPAPDQPSSIRNDEAEQDKQTETRDAAQEEGPKRVLNDHQPRTITFLLMHAARGQGEAKSLIIPKHVSSVQLLLDQPASAYDSYHASIGTVEGVEIWSGRLEKLETAKTSRKIKLNVPANRFESQDYILRVLGANSTGESEAVSQYYFRVVKK